MARILPFTKLPTLEVFAVEDTTAQITWRGLPGGLLSAKFGGVTQLLGEAAVSGAADISDLSAATSHKVDLFVDDREIASLDLHTHEALDQQPLARIATISDLHLGETGFGVVRHLRDHGLEPYPMRCARAAIREAVAWGAELIVIKGDITNEGLSHEWEMFDELLGEIPVSVVAVPGNHDNRGNPDSLDALEILKTRGLLPEPVHSVDVRGARITVVDSTVRGRNWGRLGRHLDALAAEIEVDRPVMVFTHHHFEDRVVPWFWPPGIQRHDAKPVLDRLVSINPNLLFSSGHTHRNRIRRHGPALITEVSSTKDFPGVWAGYTIHASGIRQTVRRVADPDCVSWNDRTHAAAGGIWGRWSPGGLHHRSHAHRWPSHGTKPDQEPSASKSRASSTSAFN